MEYWFAADAAASSARSDASTNEFLFAGMFLFAALIAFVAYLAFASQRTQSRQPRRSTGGRPVAAAQLAIAGLVLTAIGIVVSIVALLHDW
ncbi:hypothetical protein ACWGII_30680 [Streptomyces sp. NPDC054855]